MSAPLFRPSLAPPVRAHPLSRGAHVGVLSPYPPSLGGLATFSAALSDALCAHGADVSVVRVADGSSSPSGGVVGELINGSPPSIGVCVDLLNRNDVAVIQYDYGIYGGVDGDDVVDIIGGLRVPSIVVAHTVLKAPTPHQHSVLAWIAATADQVVVMSEIGQAAVVFKLWRRSPQGHHDLAWRDRPERPPLRRPSRPTVLTWGLLGPGKGVERVIEAMGSLKDLPGRPRYLVAGPTHPNVLAADGEAYRDARMEQARRIGVADSVSLDGRYWNGSSLSSPRPVRGGRRTAVRLHRSGHLRRPGRRHRERPAGRGHRVPHAVELLGGGAGIVVDHDDPGALASALRDILTQPRLAGSMAAEARRLAPEMAWPVVAGAYLRLSQRLIVERRAVI